MDIYLDQDPGCLGLDGRYDPGTCRLRRLNLYRLRWSDERTSAYTGHHRASLGRVCGGPSASAPVPLGGGACADARGE